MTDRFSLSRAVAAILVALVSASPSFAQQRPAPAAAAMPDGHHEMTQAMEKMNRDMTGVPMTGDPDRDLVLMMMPHHQGAIDMARIYLRDGKDPAIRRMAQKIVLDQEREIREFKAWLAKHPAPVR